MVDTTLGNVESTSAAGLVPLARHYNATTNDYLLETSITPPAGYTYQATLGYLRPAAPPAGTVTAYTRNTLGQVTQVTRPEVTYSYDPAHRPRTVTDSRGPKTLTYTYSPGGLLNSLQDGEGNLTSYLYDPVGRLTGIWAPNGDVVTFAYDPGGRLTEKWFPNGVNTRYRYNPDNTLRQVLNRVGFADTTILSQHDYSYDGIGNRFTHIEKIGASTTAYKYVYDPLDRLLEVLDNVTNALKEAYAYDSLGNRLTKTDGVTTLAYVYDAANQVKEIRQGSPSGALLASLTYDLNGNLTNRGDGRTLTYDPLNRLTQVDESGQPTQTYAYDDQGRRVRKTVGSAATSYLYDGPDIIGEYTTWASPTAGTTHGPATDDSLLRATATMAQYFHQDGLGSVVVVSNPAGGTDGAVRYDAWGNRTVVSGAVPPVYGYTGREPDETGLIFYRARYYDPTLGRFTQRDPVGVEGGTNLYAYVNGNPVNFTDPLGLLGMDPLQRMFADASANNAGGVVSDANPPGYSGLLGPRARAAGSLLLRGGEILTGVTIGAGVGWTGVGAVAGGGLIFHGVLGAGADLQQLVTGEVTSSLPSQALQAAGVPQGTADAMDVGASGGVALAGAAALVGGGAAATAVGTGGAGTAVSFDWSRAGHIFQATGGHVNPSTVASQERFARVFETVASNPANLRSNFPIPKDAAQAGVRAFTQVFQSGQQVWVYVRNGRIVDAGINPMGAHR